MLPARVQHARTHAHTHICTHCLRLSLTVLLLVCGVRANGSNLGRKKSSSMKQAATKRNCMQANAKVQKINQMQYMTGGGGKDMCVCACTCARMYAPQNDVWSEDESLACEDCCLLKRSEAVGTCRQQQQQQQQCAEEYGHVEVCERRVRWRIACL